MAIAAKETPMEEALLDRGEDAHLFTLGLIFRRTKDEFFRPDGSPRSEALAAEYKNLRRLAKNSNFASLFLVQAKKLAKMNDTTVEAAAEPARALLRGTPARAGVPAVHHRGTPAHRAGGRPVPDVPRDPWHPLG